MCLVRNRLATGSFLASVVKCCVAIIMFESVLLRVTDARDITILTFFILPRVFVVIIIQWSSFIADGIIRPIIRFSFIARSCVFVQSEPVIAIFQKRSVFTSQIIHRITIR